MSQSISVRGHVLSYLDIKFFPMDFEMLLQLIQPACGVLWACRLVATLSNNCEEPTARFQSLCKGTLLHCLQLSMYCESVFQSHFSKFQTQRLSLHVQGCVGTLLISSLRRPTMPEESGEGYGVHHHVS